MNKLIFRKLTADIFAFFLLSSLAITAIVWVIQGVNLLDIVSEQGHGIKVYFFYTILNVPKIFSKLLIFTYFITLFVVLIRYEENNEILIFWTNGIKKITFINFIGKISLLFVLLQLILNLLIVPMTQNLKQQYLKNSSIEFFPNLIKERKFTNITKNLTIFVEENKSGLLKGIYIKEDLGDGERKIIIASRGKLIENNNDFSFKLFDGNISNIDKKNIVKIKFKETVYELSKLNSKTRQINKLNEINSIFLLNCLEKYITSRKNNKIRCGEKDKFLVKDIYEEIFKRSINPIYIIVLSLVSSLLIIKPKVNFLQNYIKGILFILGFAIILFSELSYKFITLSSLVEFTFIILPILFVIIFYFYLLIKCNFKTNYL